PGAFDRVRDPARGVAREEGLPGSDGDRRGDRAAQARDDGRRDRPAHRGAGQVLGLVGRRNLAVAITSLALVPTASGAGGTMPWGELGRGSPPAAPAGAPLGYVALTRPETHVFASAVGASGRARLADVDFTRDAVVAVLGAFGCTDHRVFVSSLSQS